MVTVKFELYVEQIRDGSHYRGYVKIANTKLHYELVFAVPIPQLDEMELPSEKKAIRDLFRITLKRKDDVPVELTEEEYGFFFPMLAEFAIKFFNNPQTRGYNEEGTLGQIADLARPYGAAKPTIGITRRGSLELSPEMDEMLRAAKFTRRPEPEEEKTPSPPAPKRTSLLRRLLFFLKG